METCVTNCGHGVLLRPGDAGFLIVRSGLRAFQTDPIDAEGLAEMVRELLPRDQFLVPSKQGPLRQKEGFVELDVPFGDQWFRVAVFDYPWPTLVLLTLLPQQSRGAT
jgi:hypothetical protein